MPIHDWTRVAAGIFHDFHHSWIEELKRALNRGLLPNSLYAMAEQIAGGYGPDVLTLEGPAESQPDSLDERGGGAMLMTEQPKISFRARTEADIYATKANRISIRHVTGHRVVAVIEIVSPGNKSTAPALRTFAEKAAGLLRGSIHLMVVDLFPPSARDPDGIHRAIWSELDDCDFVLPADRPLTVASYIGGDCQEAMVESVAVGSVLPEMPLYLTADGYIRLPLQRTYDSAWDTVPPVWRRALEQESV